MTVLVSRGRLRPPARRPIVGGPDSFRVIQRGRSDVEGASVGSVTGTPLRWGILGTAKIAREALIPAIRASRNGAVRAVASRDAERARAFAEALGIPSAHGSYEALLSDEDVDAVYIPLPNSEHRAWAMRAAAHGKHVLCEKPIGLTAAESLEMERAASADHVVLMEAFMYRFHPRTERVLERVRSGAVGEVRMIRSSFGFFLEDRSNIRMNAELGGGALMDVGCYCVSMSRTIAGGEPVEVQAFARWSPEGVDEEMAGTLRFENGSLAQFDCYFTMPSRQTLEVSGTGGQITVPWAFRPGLAESTIRERLGASAASDLVARPDIEYQRMVEDFADAALEGRPTRYPVRDAVDNMRVIDALYRSARDGGRPCGVEG